MAKEVQKAEQILAEDQSARIAQLELQLNRVTTLLGDSTAGRMTPELEAHLKWAELSAEQKTRLVLERDYPAVPGTRPFRCQLMDKDGKPTECFPLSIPAHSVEEAEGRYKKLMGINRTDGKIVVNAA